MTKETIIGIDLGTTNSAVAVIEAGTPVIIPNAEGKRTTPSIIGFNNDERKVGDSAKRQSVTNPTNTIYSIKRFIGKSFKESSEEVGKVPYTVQDNGNDVPVVVINDRTYTPQELSAMILQKMKQTAEDFLGKPVTKAVITVPAYFGDAERRATIEAGQIAGLEVARIINEPTSAALAYGFDKADQEKNILVFDCGGGTHDVSVLNLADGVFEVLSTDGDTHLGGDDFDNAIIDWLVQTFKGDTGVDLSKDAMALQRLKDSAERAKIELSASTQTEINLPYITATEAGPQHINVNLTRAQFENMTSELVTRAIKCAENALKNAKLQPSDIDEVILVGGSTRIPALQNAIEKMIGKTANKSVNPDEVVALGASIQGGVLAGDVDSVLLLDVTPLSIGIETMGGIMTVLIPNNTTIPTKKTETFSTAVDNQPSVMVNLYQGERSMAKDNRALGTFHLDGINPAPKGVPQIEITIDIDANSVMNVTAIDKASGKQNSIRIEGGSQLTPEEIERMMNEAKENAEKDKEILERVQIVNTSETFVYEVEKFVKETTDLSEEDKTTIETAKADLTDKMKTATTEEISTALNSLSQTLSQFQMKYKKEDEPVSTQGDSVNDIDVDYEEVK